MPISFSCKACGKRLKAPDSAAGKTSKCPQCGKPVTCPEPVYDAEPIAEAPEILDDIDPYSDLDDGKPYGVSGPAEPEETERRRPCPMCGEMILASAAKCRFCGEVFDEGLKKATKKKKKKRSSRSYSSEDESLTGTDWILAILCTNIACILSIVYMVQGKPKGIKLLGLSVVMQLIGIAIAVAINMASPEARNPQPQPGFQPPQFQPQVQPPNMQPPNMQPPNMPQPPNFPPPNMPQPPNFPRPRRLGRPPGMPQPGFPAPPGG